MFEGQALEKAITKARRWMRSGKSLVDAPTHVKLKVLAFQKSDPEGFAEAMAEIKGHVHGEPVGNGIRGEVM